jgi:hypothetical protein
MFVSTARLGFQGLQKHQSLFQVVILVDYACQGRSNLLGRLFSSRLDRGVGQVPVKIGMVFVVTHSVLKAYDQSFSFREWRCLYVRPVVMRVARMGYLVMVMMALSFAVVPTHLNSSFPV